MSENPDRDPVSADAQRIRELLDALQPPAPSALQARIATLNDAAPPPRRGLGGFRLHLPAGRATLALGGACAAAAAAVVVVLLASGGGAPPTALRTADLALAPMKAPAPARLAAAGTNIVFPDWSTRGWPSAGMRRDRLDGRIVTTELYRSGDATIGYAIVSGGALRWGSPTGDTIKRSDGSYRVSGSAGKHVVAWVQEGHTCILASRTVGVADLLALAEQESASATAASSTPAPAGAGWVPM